MKPLNDAELQARLLFSMVVAGKSAKFAEAAMARFYEPILPGFYETILPGVWPFEYVLCLAKAGLLERTLRAARTGNYRKLLVGFIEAASAKIDLRTCAPEDLEQIKGIGPKTARFFIIWTRPGSEFAALDTHVLKWLRYLGHKAPVSTPSGKVYADLEKAFLAEAKRRGMTARQVDEMIWAWCSERRHINGEWPEKLRRTAAIAHAPLS